MISVDTNILVRILTNDEPKQVKAAKKIFMDNEIFIPKSVILETAWVLIYSYNIGKSETINSILKLISLPNVNVEGFHTVLHAISLANEGMDFADAIHLSSSDTADKLATFDKKFIRLANKLNPEISTFCP